MLPRHLFPKAHPAPPPHPHPAHPALLLLALPPSRRALHRRKLAADDDEDEGDEDEAGWTGRKRRKQRGVPKALSERQLLAKKRGVDLAAQREVSRVGVRLSPMAYGGTGPWGEW